MNPLLILDDSIDLIRFRNFILRSAFREAGLLLFYSSLSFRKEIESIFAESSIRYNFIDSPAMLEAAISRMRKGIAEWAHALAETPLWGRKVKEWLAIPDTFMSCWWFGLISEKNIYKTGLFLILAQSAVIKEVLSSAKFDEVIVGSGSLPLSKCALALARQQKLRFRAPSLVKKIIGRPKGIFSALAYAGRFLLRGVSARRRLSAARGSIKCDSGMLMVTYFPFFDPSAAERGVFLNYYYKALQEKLRDRGIRPKWLAIYVDGMNHSGYGGSLAAAEKFIKEGEKIYFLEEFISPVRLFQSLALWMRQAAIAFTAFSFLDKMQVLPKGVGSEAMPVIKALWSESFYGPKGIDGILQFMAFRNLFRKLSPLDKCIYLFEMQAWEKALNGAKREVIPRLTSIGFQHTSFSRNDLQYIYTGSELSYDNTPYSLPLPDILATNGRRATHYFEELGYKHIQEAEALRHLYLNNILQRPESAMKGKERILLVCGSINRRESLELIRAGLFVRSNLPAWRVVLRAHPALSLESVAKDAGLSLELSGLELSRQDISGQLETAAAVMVSTGALALEALAFGCEVIISASSNSIPRNPLVDYPEYSRIVSGFDGLLSALRDIESGRDVRTLQEKRGFVQGYWCLDSGLSRWLGLVGAG